MFALILTVFSLAGAGELQDTEAGRVMYEVLVSDRASIEDKIEQIKSNPQLVDAQVQGEPLLIVLLKQYLENPTDETYQAVRELVFMGADPNVRGLNGETPLRMLAKPKKEFDPFPIERKDLIALFLRFGAYPGIYRPDLSEAEETAEKFIGPSNDSEEKQLQAAIDKVYLAGPLNSLVRRQKQLEVLEVHISVLERLTLQWERAFAALEEEWVEVIDVAKTRESLNKKVEGLSDFYTLRLGKEATIRIGRKNEKYGQTPDVDLFDPGWYDRYVVGKVPIYRVVNGEEKHIKTVDVEFCLDRPQECEEKRFATLCRPLSEKDVWRCIWEENRRPVFNALIAHIWP